MRVGAHCSLYPPPPYTIYPLLIDLVLRESVNCISEVLDQETVLTSGTFKAYNNCTC